MLPKTNMKIKGIVTMVLTCCLVLNGCNDIANISGKVSNISKEIKKTSKEIINEGSDSDYISNILDIANPHLWDDAVKKG